MISKELFGKKIKDMTPEEQKEYLNVLRQKNRHNKDTYKNSWCIQHFGKRHKDLSPEEDREFYRIRQQICRQRKKEQEKVDKPTNKNV